MYEDDKEQPLQRQMSLARSTNRSADTKTPAAHSGSHIVIQGRTTAFHGGYLHLMQRALASDGTHNTTMQYDNNTNTYARRALRTRVNIIHSQYHTHPDTYDDIIIAKTSSGIVHTGLQHERASTMML